MSLVCHMKVYTPVMPVQGYILEESLLMLKHVFTAEMIAVCRREKYLLGL